MLSGHYTSYHKQNRGWMLVNDCHLTRMSKPQKTVMYTLLCMQGILQMIINDGMTMDDDLLEPQE